MINYDQTISTYPYLSGNMFVLISNWHLTTDYPVDNIERYFKHIDVNKIKDNDIVYVKLDKINEFLIKYLPKIKSNIKLISHNGDISITNEHSKFLKENVIEWWTTNNESTDSRIKSIPIGIQNKNLYFYGNPQGDNSIIDDIKNVDVEKIFDVLLTFNINTNEKHRKPIYEYFNKLSFVTERKYNNNDRKDISFIKDYLLDIKKHKFVICPWGNGYDCHRNWEVLYMGSIPIIKKHKSLEYYEDLPVWLVNDWVEVTEENLIKKYIEINTKKYDLDKLYFNYWVNKIINR